MSLPKLYVLALAVLLTGAELSAHAQAAHPSPADLAASAAASSPGGLPFKRDADSDEIVPPAYAAWLAVLGVAFLGVLLLRQRRSGNLPWLERFGTSKTVRGPRVLSARAVGTGSSLQVVEWNGKEFLLGCSAQSITVIDSRPAAGEANRGAALVDTGAGGERQ